MQHGSEPALADSEPTLADRVNERPRQSLLTFKVEGRWVLSLEHRTAPAICALIRRADDARRVATVKVKTSAGAFKLQAFALSRPPQSLAAGRRPGAVAGPGP